MRQVAVLMLAALALAPVARAETIEITVTGIADNTQDTHGNVFFLGAGNNVANGQAVTLRFALDLAAAGADFEPSANQSYFRYSGVGAPVASSWTLNGHTYSAPDDPSLMFDVQLFDDVSGQDRVLLAVSVNSGAGGGVSYQSSSSFGGPTTLLSGDGIGQLAGLTGPYTSGFSAFRWVTQSQAGYGQTGGGSVTIRPVPEPALLWLVGTALAGAILRRRSAS